MIRFVDLRGAETGYMFAFWDTVTDKFITIGDEQAWDSIADLEENAELCGLNEGMEMLKQRLIRLCPDWVPVKDFA